MLNDKTRSEIDQTVASMSEVYPTIWRSLYDGLIEKGFTPAESLTILCTYISSTVNQ